MKYQCCSKEKLKFEIISWVDNLGKKKVLEIKITDCPVLKGTFDLEIRKQEIKTLEGGK